jgi:uncharacterized membrane protein YphA (DoxX/SURF4 family)
MLTTDRVAGGALLLIGLFTVWESLLGARRLPLGTIRNPGPAYVPVLLAILLILFGLIIVAMGVRAPRMSSVRWHEWRHAAGILVSCMFAALALERLGYRVTLTVVLFGLLFALERKSLWFATVFALALANGTFFVFDTMLRVPLPRGPFGL